MSVDWDNAVLGPLMKVFGEPVTYAPVAGSSFTVTGVFDQAYRELELIDNSSAITTESPVLGVQLSQFPVAPAQGDQVSIASVNSTYRVREVRLDGHGYAKLMLNFVSSP